MNQFCQRLATEGLGEEMVVKPWFFIDISSYDFSTTTLSTAPPHLRGFLDQGNCVDLC